MNSVTVSKCIFKSFPFTLTFCTLARVFNMPACFPCHVRCFITAKCPWKKSLEYQCLLLWETNLISQLQLCTGHTGERFNGCAERKQCVLPSQQKQSSSKEKGKKKANHQTACSQTANNEAMNNRFLKVIVILSWYYRVGIYFAATL